MSVVCEFREEALIRNVRVHQTSLLINYLRIVTEESRIMWLTECHSLRWVCGKKVEFGFG